MGAAPETESDLDELIATSRARSLPTGRVTPMRDTLDD